MNKYKVSLTDLSSIEMLVIEYFSDANPHSAIDVQKDIPLSRAKTRNALRKLRAIGLIEGMERTVTQKLRLIITNDGLELLKSKINRNHRSSKPLGIVKFLRQAADDMLRMADYLSVYEDE